MLILESAFGLIEVSRNFRSIKPAVVQGFQSGIPNSRDTDGRIDLHIVQRKVMHGSVYIDLVMIIRNFFKGLEKGKSRVDENILYVTSNLMTLPRQIIVPGIESDTFDSRYR